MSSKFLPYMGFAEVAEFLGVTTQATHLYRTGQRRKDIKFPEPYFELQMGPVWRRDDIELFKWKLSQKP